MLPTTLSCRGCIRLLVYGTLGLTVLAVFLLTRTPESLPPAITLRWLGYTNNSSQGRLGWFEITAAERNVEFLAYTVETNSGPIEFVESGMRWRQDTNFLGVLGSLARNGRLEFTTPVPEQVRRWRLNVTSVTRADMTQRMLDELGRKLQPCANSSWLVANLGDRLHYRSHADQIPRTQFTYSPAVDPEPATPR